MAPADVSATAAKVQQRRFEGLEAYRAVTALLLITFHTYQYSREALHVPHYVYHGRQIEVWLLGLRLSGWFFVLSGFLAFLPFARAAVEQQAPRSARGYLVNRFVRLLPPYYLVFILVWTWRFFGTPTQWVDLVEHLTFTHIFDSKRIFWTIGPAWTLGIEFWFAFFIALFGTLAYYVLARFRTEIARVTVLATALIGLGLMSIIYKWLIVYGLHIREYHHAALYFNPLAKLDTLAIGMGLALAVASGRVQVSGKVALLLRVVGFACMPLLILTRPKNDVIDFLYYTLTGGAFVLILASTVLGPRGSRWERVLSWRPFQFLGTISYSIYLWHEPILIELGKRNFLIHEAPAAYPSNVLILLSLSIVVATLSYYALERPLALLRHLFTRDGQFASRYAATQTRS
ncbi:MAG: acyltransferase [Herpetosiphon sp.]